jgi:hypothetical protein
MPSARVRLIRFVSFDGAALTFFENTAPTVHESLPLDSAYHGLARQLPNGRLCEATILNGTIVVLAVTKVREP